MGTLKPLFLYSCIAGGNLEQIKDVVRKNNITITPSIIICSEFYNKNNSITEYFKNKLIQQRLLNI